MNEPPELERVGRCRSEGTAGEAAVERLFSRSKRLSSSVSKVELRWDKAIEEDGWLLMMSCVGDDDM